MAWTRFKNYLVQYLGLASETPFIKVTWLDNLVDYDWTKQSFTGATNIYQAIPPIGSAATVSATQLHRLSINTMPFPDGNYCLFYYTDNAGTLNPSMAIEYFSVYQGSPNAIVNPSLALTLV